MKTERAKSVIALILVFAILTPVLTAFSLTAANNPESVLEATSVFTGGDNQKWIFEAVEGKADFYYIKNKHTGTYLTRGEPHATTSFSHEPKDTGKYQEWGVYYDEQYGHYYIYAEYMSCRLGFSTDGSLFTEWNSTDFTPVSLLLPAFNGTVEVGAETAISARNGMYLQVDIGTQEEPEPVNAPVNATDKFTNGDHQKWIFESVAGKPDFYYIKNKYTGTYLTRGEPYNTSIFSQEPKAAGKYQEWGVYYDAQYGHYYIYAEYQSCRLGLSADGSLFTEWNSTDFTPVSLLLPAFNESVEVGAETAISARNGMYLQVDIGEQEDTEVRVITSKTATGKNEQLWIFEEIPGAPQSNGAKQYYIKNKATGLYLSRLKNDGTSSKYFLTEKAKSGVFQNWYVYEDSNLDGFFYISASEYLSLRLSIGNEGNIYETWNWEDVNYHAYKLEGLENELEPDRETTICSYGGWYLSAELDEKDVPGDFGGYVDNEATRGMYGQIFDLSNLLLNGGFEKGTSTWGAIFGGVSYKAVKENARSGQQALLVTGATAEYHTASTSIAQILREKGDGYYRIGAYVKPATGQQLPENFSMNIIFYGAKGVVINGKTITADGQINNLIQRPSSPDEKGYYYISTTMHIQGLEGFTGTADLALWLGMPVDHYIDDAYVFFSKESSIIDGSFEKDLGMIEGPFGSGVKAERDSNTANSGTYSAKLTNISNKESSLAFDITDIIKSVGNGVYEFGGFAKSVSSTMEAFGIRIMVEGTGQCVNGAQPDTSGYFSFAQVTPNKFTELSRRLMITDASKITKVYLLFYPGESADFYLDDVYVRSYLPVQGGETDYKSPVPQTILDRQEETSIGAIRWDYWGTDPSQDRYAQNLKSPAYRFRLPWYAIVDKNTGAVKVPDYTQEIVDQEIAYAKRAGIDYWAFVMYDEPGNRALQLYLSSKNKNDVKWCAILGLSDWSNNLDEKIQWLKQQFATENYQKVMDGRPLIFAEGRWATMIRSACKDMEKQPYIVSMLHTESVDEAKANGVDAISRYSNFSAGENGSEYTNIIEDGPKKWNEMKATTMQVVPNVTTGWDPRPRFENGDLGSGTRWNQNATASEIVHNLQNALTWVDSNKFHTFPNTILMYAWNEFDEGGWLCPTYNEADPSKPNTQRIDALQMLLNNDTPGVIVTSESDSDKVIIGMPVRMKANLLSQQLLGKKVTWSVKNVSGAGNINAETGLFTGTKTGTVIVKATVVGMENVFGELTLYVVAYKNDLYEKILYMKTVDGTSYPLKAWQAFQEAIRKAEQVYDDEDCTQEEVDNAIKDLDKALKALQTSKFPTEDNGNIIVIPPGDDDNTDVIDDEVLSEELIDKAIKQSAGNYITVSVKKLSILTPAMLEKVLAAGKPLRIELIADDGTKKAIIEVSNIKDATREINLEYLPESANQALINSKFGAEDKKLSIAFTSSGEIGASVRIFVLNTAGFNKSEKMYLYLIKDGEIVQTDNSVSITSNEQYIAFTVDTYGEYLVSDKKLSSSVDDNKNDDKKPDDGVPANDKKTGNTLIIILIITGVVIIGAGAGVFILFRSRKKN